MNIEIWVSARRRSAGVPGLGWSNSCVRDINSSTSRHTASVLYKDINTSQLWVNHCFSFSSSFYTCLH